MRSRGEQFEGEWTQKQIASRKDKAKVPIDSKKAVHNA